MNNDTPTPEPELLVSRKAALGSIVLNRPKVLNALTLSMIRQINAALDAFESDDAIAAVMVSGAGERGFCAGGDIRLIHESGRAGSPLAETFWREEYRLNARISHFTKPVIAIMDGIVMGGGVGLAAHASHRFVTDTTRLAMPETGIGFFPDIGASWLLSRPGSEFGTYIGLTGVTIGAGEAISAGLADYYIRHGQLDRLYKILLTLPYNADGSLVEARIGDIAEEPPTGITAEELVIIERVFAHSSVEAIIAALQAEGSDFARATLALLLARSPTSLCVTLRLLRSGRQSSDLETCLAREFAGTQAVLASHDFYEGVRAAVIDKDRRPQWSPPTLNLVGEGAVNAYFVAHPRPLF